ncbi:MAG: sigma-70 family RNA polymerase sigma factor [Planctomycetes bacterium]|nr:sigma-70 family RNA polymerase sigma factor [Planctomycetota bacterium]
MPQTRGLLDQLVRRYWKPVYIYIRAAWRKPNEEAKDLTQAFFTHLLEGTFFSRLKPEKGNFRAYLKKALRNFLIDAERFDKVRRPEKPIVSLDIAMDQADLAPPAPGEAPEAAYDRAWFRCLLDGAVDGLWQFLSLEGRLKYFEVFSLYCLHPITSPDGFRPGSGETATQPTYRDVAQTLSLTEAEVRHYLEFCRAHLRRILSERIREYAATDDEVKEELKQIIGE